MMAMVRRLFGPPIERPADNIEALLFKMERVSELPDGITARVRDHTLWLTRDAVSAWTTSRSFTDLAGVQARVTGDQEAELRIPGTNVQYLIREEGITMREK